MSGSWPRATARCRKPSIEQIEAGACGLKDHEDHGSTPAVIDCSLRVADEYDVQVCIHTDSLNEAGFVEDTISAIDGRTIHTYHTEGAGGGHAPDIIKIAGQPWALPSSTNPTLPYTVNSVAELLDMVMVCHHLNPKVPEDVSFAESRVRAETISAETVLHDMGVISMISADSQAMGRCGENFTRAFQMAHVGKERRGKLPEDSPKQRQLPHHALSLQGHDQPGHYPRNVPRGWVARGRQAWRIS